MSAGESAPSANPSAAASSPIAYKLSTDIQYRLPSEAAGDPYIAERCVLDLYWPEGQKGFKTIVWIHGGGLGGGDKCVPPGLKESGLAVAAIRYRLSPQVKCSVCVEDAAAAVAWILRNIESYGGDPSKVVVSGHSAGGYLTSMIGLDKSWLGKHGVDANCLAALAPISGHAITHFSVRGERGIPDTKPLIDEMAPLFFVRPDAPPILLVTGDREKEMLGRYEENAYFMRMLKLCGHKDVTLFELQGYDHGMDEPAMRLIKEFVARAVPS